MNMTSMSLKLQTGKMLPFVMVVEEAHWDGISCDKKATVQQCLKCKMYNNRGGCPPRSPEFKSKYYKKFKHVYLLMFRIPFHQWESEKVARLGIAQRFMFGSGFIETVFKTFERNVTRILREQGTVLPSSYCSICKKCVASVQGCVHPDDRMYSPESLGVMVNDTLVAQNMEELEWFRYGQPNATIPRYIRKVIFFMSDQELDQVALVEGIRGLKNVVSILQSRRVR